MANIAGRSGKASSRVWLIVAILVFVGALVGLQYLSAANTRPAVAHDHDGDGKPDHGDETHD